MSIGLESVKAHHEQGAEAQSNSEPVNELQTPMAIVILGGLLSATALNMVVLPALYWLFGDRAAPKIETEEGHLVSAVSPA